MQVEAEAAKSKAANIKVKSEMEGLSGATKKAIGDMNKVRDDYKTKLTKQTQQQKLMETKVISLTGQAVALVASRKWQ